LAYGDGVVVIGVTTPGGPRLEAFDATGTQSCSGAPKKCQPIWVTDAWTGTGAEAPPALLNGRVYRAVGTQLRAYDLHGSTSCSGAPKVCTPLWGVQVGSGVSGAVVANGLIYVGAADGSVHAYDTNGVSRWTANVGSPVGSVEVWDGHVYVGTADGRVQVFGLG
jgi:outer membrane protein assembly factor BamB